VSYLKELDDVQMKNTLSEKLETLHIWFGTQTLFVAMESINNLPNVDINHSVILDIGTGNGHFCQLLRAQGFKNIFGSDYSLPSIKLATHLNRLYNESITSEAVDTSDHFSNNDVIAFRHDNILKTSFQAQQFDIIFDKGVFDCMAIIPQMGEDENNDNNNDDSDTEDYGNENYEELKPFEKYRFQLLRLLKNNGYYMIISCSHNLEEIQHVLIGAGENIGFRLVIDISDRLEKGLVMAIFQKVANG